MNAPPRQAVQTTPLDEASLFQALRLPQATVVIRFPEETAAESEGQLTINLKNRTGKVCGTIRIPQLQEDALNEVTEEIMGALPSSNDTQSPLGKESFTRIWDTIDRHGCAVETVLGSTPHQVFSSYLTRWNGTQSAATSADKRVRIMELRKVSAQGSDSFHENGTFRDPAPSPPYKPVRTAQESLEETLGREKKFHWVRIENPTEEILQEVAETVKLSMSTLKRALDPSERSTTYRHKNSLVTTIEEFELDEKNPCKLSFKDVHAFISDTHLITISEGPSAAVNRVWDEIKNNEVDRIEKGSSNYVFCRILGSTLHSNNTVLKKLEAATRELHERTSQKSEMEIADRAMLSSLSISGSTARHTVNALREVILALKEERNLFGAGKPRDALERYMGIQTTMNSMVNFIEKEVSVVLRTWREINQDETNNLLFRLTVAGGIFLVPGAAFDFFQVPLKAGWTDSQIWLGLGIASVASAVLVGGLFYKKTKNWLSSKFGLFHKKECVI